MDKQQAHKALVYKHKKSAKEHLKDQQIILSMVLIVMSIIVSLINPRFIALNNIILIFQQISIVGVLTMAMAMLMLGGGVDLSLGNMMVLTCCAMSVLISENKETGFAGFPVGAAIGIGVVIGLVCGILNGFIIAKTKCSPLVITLGLSGVYYGIALIITKGRVMSFRMTFEPIRLMRIFGLIPITLVWFLMLVIVTYFLINKTKFGRRIVAIGGNEANARLCGIRVDRYKMAMYAIGGLYCVLAAIIYASRLDAVSAASGKGYETAALTGAIIGGITFDGGRGTISGAFLGALFMGVLENALNVLAVDTFIQTVISGIIIVAAVVVSNFEQIRRK